ncbi:MAG: hypothetical protein IPI57_06055 [Candidatus Competibacteraceae bacterium]|nr:hypothetical protein [Candidatus Competibacteraceae bacterium]
MKGSMNNITVNVRRTTVWPRSARWENASEGLKERVLGIGMSVGLWWAPVAERALWAVCSGGIIPKTLAARLRLAAGVAGFFLPG